MSDTNDKQTEPAEFVTIKRSLYERLRQSEKFLRALEAAGVDNWDGYSIAYSEVYGDDEDE